MKMKSRYTNLIESILDDTYGLEVNDMGSEIISDELAPQSYTLDDIINHLDNGGEVVIEGVSEYDEGDITLYQNTPREASDYPYQSGRSWMSFILEEGKYGEDYKEVSIHNNETQETGLYIVYSTTEGTGLEEDEYPDSYQTGYIVTDIMKDDLDTIIISVIDDPDQIKHMVF